MRSIYLLTLGLLAGLALPTIAAEQKGGARMKSKTNKQYEAMKPKRSRPDVTVEILPSTDAHSPALAKIVNIGNAGTGDFQLAVQITALCEAGKLTASVAAQDTPRTIHNVAAGDDNTKFTSIMPEALIWAENCSYKVMAKASSVANESNTSNNTGLKTFCPTGNCY